MGKNTAAVSGDPYLCGIGCRLAFGDVDMDGLVVLIGPEVHLIAAYGKQVRQSVSLRLQRIYTAGGRCS